LVKCGPPVVINYGLDWEKFKQVVITGHGQGIDKFSPLLSALVQVGDVQVKHAHLLLSPVTSILCNPFIKPHQFLTRAVTK